MSNTPLFALCFCLVLTACNDSDSLTTNADAKCKELTGISIAPESIALPTGGATVTSAVYRYTPATAYCELVGAIAPVDPVAPDINFQINLPAYWNNKGLHYGSNDTYNGQLVTSLNYVEFNANDSTLPTPLSKGYATWGSDGGQLLSDGSSLMNDEALRNFGGEQLKKTHDVALAVIDIFYQQQAEQVYIQGSGGGGREALIAAQRWPNDYSGAIAVNPITSLTGLYVGSVLADQALSQPDASLDTSDITLLNTSLLDTCDELDGDLDGIISDAESCATTFDVMQLSCEEDLSNAGACLNEAQTTAFVQIAEGFSSPELADGIQAAGWPLYTGQDLTELFKQQSPYFNPAITASAFIRYALLRDPDANPLEFTPADNAARITELSSLTDVSSDLTELNSMGGKVLVLHGDSNFDIPYGNTLNWQQQVATNTGQQSADAFLKYWLINGFGNETDNTDFQWQTLDALEAWVERGIEPVNLVSAN